MIQIKDITVYTKPKKYLAVEAKDGIYEIPLSDLFQYIFKGNTPLQDYYYNSETLADSIDLYHDLISLGYDIQEQIKLYIDNNTEKCRPIPKNVYPLVLRYYKGIIDIGELFILQAALGIDLGITPDEDDFQRGWDIDPPGGDDPMPF